MGFRDLFLHVALFVLAGALSLWWVLGTEPDKLSRPPTAPAVTIDPPAAGELPAPRGPRPPLPVRLAQAGLSAGDAAFIRIFKQESQLELWLKHDGRYVLFETYPICAWSGLLGPKQKEGDGQSPEGFYEVGRKQLNPNSAYHLAFNLGYPNAYDRALGRTGSALMVHGACASIGCYAMTDRFITEIYGLVEAALNRGQRSVPVHVFPFRMTAETVAVHGDSAWAPFWANLKQGYDAFEASGAPPAAYACAGRYGFGDQGRAGCDRVTAW
ncbi:MAG: murein L,D-transpeptidase [Alphaproteobacteria bacterium]|nr:murein L,D-transpeptidase [Alphaproteobacteria bacterium]